MLNLLQKNTQLQDTISKFNNFALEQATLKSLDFLKSKGLSI